MKFIKAFGMACVLAFSQQSAFAGIFYQNEISIGVAPLDDVEDGFFIHSVDFKKQFRAGEFFRMYAATTSDFFQEKIASPHVVFFKDDGLLYRIGENAPAGFLFPCNGSLDCYVLSFASLEEESLWADILLPRGEMIPFPSGGFISLGVFHEDRNLLVARIEDLPVGKKLKGNLTIKKDGTTLIEDTFSSEGETTVDLVFELAPFWDGTIGDSVLEAELGKGKARCELPAHSRTSSSHL